MWRVECESEKGLESEKSLPRGGVVPGSRSMAQSYGRWGGKVDMCCLLKTWVKSEYSAGTRDSWAESGSLGTDRSGLRGSKQVLLQVRLHSNIFRHSNQCEGYVSLTTGNPR